MNTTRTCSATQLVEFCISTKYKVNESKLSPQIQKTFNACLKYFAKLILLVSKEDKCVNLTLNNNNQLVKVFESKLPDSFISNINDHCLLFKEWHHETQKSQNNPQQESILFELPTDAQIKTIFKFLIFCGYYEIENMWIGSYFCDLTFYATFEKWELFPSHYCNKYDNILNCSPDAILIIVETINQKHWLENIFIFEQMFLQYVLNLVVGLKANSIFNTYEDLNFLDFFVCATGGLLYFCSHQISNMFLINSEQELKKKIQWVIDYEMKMLDVATATYYQEDKYSNCHPEIVNANDIFQFLKTCSINVRKHGNNMLAGSYRQFQKLQNQSIKLPDTRTRTIDELVEQLLSEEPSSNEKFFHDSSIPCYAYFIFAKWFATNRQLRKSQVFYIASVIASNTYYQRIISLRRLIKICMYWMEYAAARKMLKYAYNLCHIAENEGLIVFPSFVTTKYYKLRKRISDRTKKLYCCSHCKRQQGVNLKACTGCMIAVYCNKSHQKRHWKIIHRKECSRLWKSNYKLLKSVVKSPLVFL
eukprot:425983_1